MYNMISEIDLRELSKISSKDRAFLTVYVEDIKDLKTINQRLENLGHVIANDYEKEIYNENIKLLHELLKKEINLKGCYVFFICWLLNFTEFYELEIPISDQVIIDSSPFIKPIAEIKDEYEDFAVVVADNDRARVFLISALKEQDQKVIKGKIKNHVKVGGWSQQRYERRRDKQLHHYVQDIIDYLHQLEHEHDYSRIVMVGAKEVLTHLEKELPLRLKNKLITDEVIDLKQQNIDEEIYKLFTELERQEEENLWNQIKSKYVAGGLAVVGLEEVLKNLKVGRVEAVLVDRNYQPQGIRCRNCGNLIPEEVDKCPLCNSEDVFSVDLVNEITEWAYKTSALIEYADNIEELKKLGSIAALLRF
ncbi:MAG: hypothetical protein APR63_11630 [Desulfuromonas sp. SDB]|nr:MAG: hypothetical protein APR63_11630 [Desulfuromonas sp. SDB]